MRNLEYVKPEYTFDTIEDKDNN